MGFKCVYGGQEAIDTFIADFTKTCCTTRFRFVFMDINMPVVDGYEATR